MFNPLRFCRQIMPAMSLEMLYRAVPGFAAACIQGRILNRPISRGPLFITWFNTFDCNLRCSFCTTHELKRIYPSTLELDRRLSLADEIAGVGTIIVGFTGGEPLLDPNLFKVVRRLKSHGLGVYIVTNGLLLSRCASEIIDAGVDYVVVSIDSDIPEEHDAGRGQRGVFEAAIRGVARLRELRSGPKPMIKTTTVMFKNNMGRIADILDFLQRSVADVVSVQPVMGGYNKGPHGIDMERDLPDYIGDRQAAEWAIRLASMRYPIFRQKYYRLIPRFWHDPLSIDVPCWSPFLRLIVYPDGVAAHCVVSPNMPRLGNLDQTPLMDVWNGGEMQRQREMVRTRKNNCLCWSQADSFNAMLDAMVLPNQLPILHRRPNVEQASRDRN